MSNLVNRQDRKAAATQPVVFYTGRTARVVGERQNIDPKDMPHARNSRGELGKPLYNWWHNRPSSDPLGRLGIFIHAADQRNVLSMAFSKIAGDVNPDKTEVPDAGAMARHIKRVARFIGADDVGIAPVDPAYLYVGDTSDYAVSEDRRGNPAELARRYPYAICCLVAWDYDMGRAHRHRIGDTAYFFSLHRQELLLRSLAAYIRELGYTAIRSAANPMPFGVLAGLGELGRNGLLISKKYGARVQFADVILTDLPLALDKPIDIGVEDFCKVCRKCATSCPTNSIPMGDKVIHNGVQKYKINWETCYKLRPHVFDSWEICLTCVTVCPYTKPNTWWRTAAVKTLQLTPPPLRYPIIRALKWLDDRLWGVVPRRRVKWLGYDSGIPPGENTCAIAGCGAHSSGVASERGQVGYYVPLHENARRFEGRSRTRNRV